MILQTKAEYLAAREAAKEAVWIRSFLIGLDVMPRTSDPVSLLCDNTGAVALAQEPRFHNRSKHILSRYHLIRDRGDVEIKRVSTNDNMADPLTKAQLQPRHEKHVRSMGVDWNLGWN